MAGFAGSPGPQIAILESFLEFAGNPLTREPTVTISGDEMDLIACAVVGCAAEKGVLFSSADLIGGGGEGVFSTPAYGGPDEDFLPDRYSLTANEPAAIPLPASALPMLSAAALAAGLRR